MSPHPVVKNELMDSDDELKASGTMNLTDECVGASSLDYDLEPSIFRQSRSTWLTITVRSKLLRQTHLLSIWSNLPNMNRRL